MRNASATLERPEAGDRRFRDLLGEAAWHDLPAASAAGSANV